MIELNIVAPSELIDERTKLIDEIIHLMRKQAKSNARYATRILNKRNKLRMVERRLNGDSKV